MKKVMIKDGLTRFYGRLKTEKGIRHAFVEPMQSYEVADDFEKLNQKVRVPKSDATLERSLEASGISFTKTSSQAACCPKKAVNIYEFQPFEVVDESLYTEVDDE